MELVSVTIYKTNLISNNNNIRELFLHFTYQVNKFTVCVRDFLKLISASVLKRYLSKFTHLDIVERGIKPLQRGNKTPPDKIS